MKILKFGGKSLAQPEGFSTVLSIIEKQYNIDPNFHVVVSAFGDTTDQLEKLLELAAQNTEYKSELQRLKEQHYIHTSADVNTEFLLIENLLEGISLLRDYHAKHKDLLLAQGEIIAAKTLTHHLLQRDLPAHYVDARPLLITDQNFGHARPLEEISKQNTIAYFEENILGEIGIITGFIGSTSNGETSTLGRNGSNYSASLFASYLSATELQSYTHINGIYTANPDWVPDAQKIDNLSYDEAHEMAYLGASILHAKTILPLLHKQIPLRIINTFNPDDYGTLISANPSNKGIRALSVLEKTSLIQLIGKGMSGKIGIDARIFETLARHQISVNAIAQGASEHGISFVVNATDTTLALKALRITFKQEIEAADISAISSIDQVSVLSIIGQDLSRFNRSYNALINNQIVPLLINNTVMGHQISLVLHHHQLQKALNIIHGEIFGINKKINLVVFGVGTVGSVLIEQLLQSRSSLEKKRNVSVRVVGVSNSKQLLFAPNGIADDWRIKLSESPIISSPENVFEQVEQYHLENLIAVDLTASSAFTETYPQWIRNGFDLVAANKIANTKSYDFYQNLRVLLKKHHKEFLYETNVGAGLPLIDTIQLLHQSGENITRIRGVFSGTLSYLFNEFSDGTADLSSVLKRAIEKGFTEPDPREDLNGNDVARKLLILARELELPNEMSDIRIQNLIPKDLQSGSVAHFLERLEELDPLYKQIKTKQEADYVLRYVGDLHGDLSREDGALLDVALISVPIYGALGQLKGSDSIFEIYTESYGSNPIVIQGAGAGASVTARGVFGDILRLVNRNS